MVRVKLRHSDEYIRVDGTPEVEEGGCFRIFREGKLVAKYREEEVEMFWEESGDGAEEKE